MKNPNMESLKYFLVVGVESPVVQVLYWFRTGSEPVLDWYRFSCPVAVPGTGWILTFTILGKKTVKIVYIN